MRIDDGTILYHTEYGASRIEKRKEKEKLQKLSKTGVIIEIYPHYL